MSATIVDRSPALHLEPEFFDKSEDWKFVEVDGEQNRKLVSFVPGTWIEVQSWMNPNILAVFSCPACKGIRFLVKGVHTIEHDGRVKPDIQCKANGCQFHRRVYLNRWNKKPVYACALERWNPRTQKWSPEVHYVSATSQQEAREQLGNTLIGAREVSIGPAIGFFVKDGKDDTKLVAEASNAEDEK